MKKVLVFGAGRVAGPCVRQMLKDEALKVTVVDQVLDNAREISCKINC